MQPLIVLVAVLAMFVGVVAVIWPRRPLSEEQLHDRALSDVAREIAKDDTDRRFLRSLERRVGHVGVDEHYKLDQTRTAPDYQGVVHTSAGDDLITPERSSSTRDIL